MTEITIENRNTEFCLVGILSIARNTTIGTDN